MFVKFCGFTRKCDVEEAIRCGVDAIGFVFYKNSPRYVSVNQAHELLQCVVGTTTKTVGVFVDTKPSQIVEIVNKLNLSYAQVYSLEIMKQINHKVPVLMGYRIKDEKDISNISIPPNGYVLLDSYSPNAYGGTGVAFDWNLLRAIPLSKAIISGGLNCENVASLIRSLNPFGVDVSSGIEDAPGKKSIEKMRAFMRHVKEAVNEKTAQC